MDTPRLTRSNSSEEMPRERLDLGGSSTLQLVVDEDLRADESRHGQSSDVRSLVPTKPIDAQRIDDALANQKEHALLALEARHAKDEHREVNGGMTIAHELEELTIARNAWRSLLGSKHGKGFGYYRNSLTRRMADLEEARPHSKRPDELVALQKMLQENLDRLAELEKLEGPPGEGHQKICQEAVDELGLRITEARALRTNKKDAQSALEAVTAEAKKRIAETLKKYEKLYAQHRKALETQLEAQRKAEDAVVAARYHLQQLEAELASASGDLKATRRARSALHKTVKEEREATTKLDGERDKTDGLRTTTEELARRGRHSEAAEKQRKDLKHQVAYLELSEARYPELLARVEERLGDDVGVGSFDGTLYLGAGVGMADPSGTVGVNAGLKLTYGYSMNIQDDRRLRVAHSLSLGASASASMAGLLDAGLDAGLSSGVSESFLDAKHYAAVMAARFAAIRSSLHEPSNPLARAWADLSRGGRESGGPRSGVTPEDLESLRETFGEDAGEAIEIAQIATAAQVGETRSKKVSGSASAAVFGGNLSGSVSASAKENKFVRGDGSHGEKRHGKERSWSAEVGLGPFSLALTWTKIEGHSNPNNDGYYRNIKVSTSASATQTFCEASGGSLSTAGLEDWAARMDGIQIPGNDETTGALDFIAGLFSHSLGIPLSAPVTATFGVSGTAAVELNFIQDASKAWRRQYTRHSGDMGLALGLTVPVANGVTVSLGGSVTRAKATSESMGDKTLTYAQTVADGLMPRGDRDAKLGLETDTTPWQSYAAAHQSELWSLFRNTGLRIGACQDELQADLTAAKDARALKDAPQALVQAADALISAASRFGTECITAFAADDASKPAPTLDKSRFDPLALAFDAYLAARVAFTKHDQARHWQPRESNGKKARAEQKAAERASRSRFAELASDARPGLVVACVDGKDARAPLAPALDVFETVTARQLLLHDEDGGETWDRASSLASLLERGHPVLIDMNGHRLQIDGPPEAAIDSLAERIARKTAPDTLPDSMRALLRALGTSRSALRATEWDETTREALREACEAIVNGEHDFLFPDPGL